MRERINVIQHIIDRKGALIYLEIGILNGYCFLRLKIPKKFGVDPKISIKKYRNFLSLLKNPSNVHNEYFEMTSDEFFKKKSGLLIQNPLDVIFIDGLHTYEQSLKDFLNSIKFMRDDGVIIMHDCNPPTEDFTISACGDVWKTIVHLRTFYNDLNVFVLDCDMGLGIIMKSQRQNNLLKLTENNIKRLGFKDLQTNREYYLNLKKPHYFNTFINSI